MFVYRMRVGSRKRCSESEAREGQWQCGLQSCVRYALFTSKSRPNEGRVNASEVKWSAGEWSRSESEVKSGMHIRECGNTPGARSRPAFPVLLFTRALSWEGCSKPATALRQGSCGAGARSKLTSRLRGAKRGSSAVVSQVLQSYCACDHSTVVSYNASLVRYSFDCIPIRRWYHQSSRNQIPPSKHSNPSPAQPSPPSPAYSSA